MRRRALATLAALLGPAVLGGCDALRTFFGVTAIPTPIPVGTASPSPAPTPPVEIRAEVLDELQKSTYLSLFSSRLINDGIGIFAGTEVSNPAGARRWGRDYKDVAVDLETQASVFLGQSSGRALVVFRRAHAGTWLGDFPWRKALVRKGFQEAFHREALFEDRGTWRLAALSVAIQRPATTSVEIADVTLSTANGSVTYTTGPNPENRLVPLSRLTAGGPGDPLRISVRCRSEKVAVYAYLGGTRRQPLAAEGSDAAGWRFGGEVPFPDVQDLGQVGIDVIARSTLEDTAAGYDATLWGVPVRRTGGAL